MEEEQNSGPKVSYTGVKFKITHCKGALESFDNALNKVHAHKRKSFTRGIIQQIQRLVDGHAMSKENFPPEGALPSGKKFNALKRIPIRGYCWRSERHESTYFISHYVYKDFDKLDENDTKKVNGNWTRIEVNYDER